MKQLLFSFLCFFSVTGFAQKDISGKWLGTLKAGVDLRLLLQIEKQGEGFAGKMISIDQGNATMTLDTIIESKNKVEFSIKKLGVSYSGILDADTMLIGTFTQMGQQLPLKLVRTLEAPKINRPQQPKPPFPYQEKEVSFKGGADDVTLAGTLTLPENNSLKKNNKLPAVVLITGSGAQDRNEEIMNHQPFAVLADYLARKGIAVLRYDDRGTAKSTGNFGKSTSEDFAKDALGAVNFLKTFPGIDAKRIGLIGHSEGGMIAPMVAAQTKDVAFILMWAGPAEKITDLMVAQNIALLKSIGNTEAEANAYGEGYRIILNHILNPTIAEGEKLSKAKAALNEWAATKDTALLKKIRMRYEENRLQIYTQLAMSTGSPWMKYFLNYDPKDNLTKLKIPVMALYGEKDIQVLAASNEKVAKQYFAKNKKAVVLTLPELNHLFQTCKECTVVEYGQLEETIAPIALKTMGDWVIKTVR